MSSDNYEFSKSCMAQGVELESPYVSKQWQFINDINSQSYSNSGNTLVQFDGSSIFNSATMVSMSEAYITIPIVLTSAYVSSNTVGTVITALPSTISPWAVHSLKSGYFHLLNGADLIINGVTVEQFQPQINNYINFRLLSQFSVDDLKNIGPSLGLGDTLDNPSSLKFNGTGNQVGTSATAYPAVPTGVTGLQGGNGLANNFPFPVSGLEWGYVTESVVTPSVATSTAIVISAANSKITVGQLITGIGIPDGIYVSAVSGTAVTASANVTIANNAEIQFLSLIPGFFQGVQNNGSVNDGLISRMKKHSDYTNGTYNNLYGSSTATGSGATNIMSINNINAEFKPYSAVANGYISNYDIAVIRLGDIFDSLNNYPLTSKFDGIMRFYINCGSVQSIIMPNGNLLTSGAGSTFLNTCPLIQNCLLNTPSGATGIGSSLCIGKTSQTNLFGGLNLASSAASNVMTSCRLYFPQVTLKPEKLSLYISQNTAKKVCYTSVLYNQFNNINAGTTFSTLVQSGVSNIRGVLIIPFNSASTNGSVLATLATGYTTFAQALSPFDTAPASSGPFSLINLQVAIGGTNILQNTLNYTYENFLEQVGVYEKINGISDIGISCGLISENFWTNFYRAYYVDCTRCNISDMNTPRNVNVSFLNNTNCTIDVMIFTEYFTELTVNVQNGRVNK
jgi:hypothetical protein